MPDKGERGWDDDRPGMMRVHVAQRRAQELCDDYTRDGLRIIARQGGVATGYPTKYEQALAIVMAGADPRYLPAESGG